MEKILLAIDAVHPDFGSLEFACYLAKLTKSRVTGVFMENLVADQKPVFRNMYDGTYLDWEIDKESPEYKSKMELIEKNINLFREKCIEEEARHEVLRNQGVPAKELIEESRFADLIVVDTETSFKGRPEGEPTTFVKDILHDAECPVVIAPESFEGIDEIVFAYNKTASSVFAIKIFTYLFPQFYNKKASIIMVNENGGWPARDKANITGWLSEHYRNLEFIELKGDRDSVLFDYLHKRKDIFLVMGAYGRNAISEFFKHSSADILVKTVTAPIFIAHH